MSEASSKRIVSLVPSTTETLYPFGLSERIVGVTDFCVRPHPHALPRGTIRIGGTKTPDRSSILALAPDLVLANQEENRLEDVQALREAGVFVDVAYPRSVPEAIEDLIRLGHRLGVESAGERLAADASAALDRLQRAAQAFDFAYLIWRRPWMAAGQGTFINALLSEAGGRNIFGDDAGRYPTLSQDLAELRTNPPTRILLSDEPYPFGQRHVDEVAAQLSRANNETEIERWKQKIHLVSGEDHSWHGVRMIEALARVAAWVEGL